MNIPASWKVPKSLRSRIGHTAGRQRVVYEEGCLMLILHRMPEPDDRERHGVFFYRDGNGLWRGPGRKDGRVELARHLQHFEETVDALDDRLEQVDSAEDYYDILVRINPIHRAAKGQHLALQKTRELVGDNPEIINLRDQAADIERTAELLKEDARNGLHYEIARRTAEEARQGKSATVAAHRLNVMVAMFLPLTAISTMFGANIPTGLEHLASPAIFWCIVTLALALGWILRSLILRNIDDH